MKKASLLLMLVSTMACGSNSPAASSAPAATKAAYTISASPDPIVAAPDTLAFPYMATFTLTVTETAGVGANVEAVNITLHELAPSRDRFLVQFNSSDVLNRAGSSHVGAKGTLNIPITLHYEILGSGRQATLLVGIVLVDDFGNRVGLPTVTLNIV